MSLPSFRTDLKRGEAGEQQLDAFFSRHYQILAVDMATQKRGIDRIWTDHTFGRRFTVEYKTDSHTATTGNVFVEYVSNDQRKTPGWAVHSEAQLLVYFIPQTRKVHLLDMLRLKSMLPEWMETMPRRSILNQQGYSTLGLLVPLSDVLAVCCIKTMVMPEP